MVIRTVWPGATARQVQEEVTDRIARKLQEYRAVSIICAATRAQANRPCFSRSRTSRPRRSEIPGTRCARRSAILLTRCQAGVQGPFFNDEFGDVYTNLYALEGDGFSPAQLHDYGDRLRSELLRVPDVNKVDFIADQEQRVHVEIANAQLAKLGLTPQQIADAVGGQNAVSGAGVFTTADDRVYVRPSGQFQDVGQIAETLIRVNGRTIRLGDIATISRGYIDPPAEYMRVDRQNVLGVGVTMVPSGDVIPLGKALDARPKALAAALPAGLRLVEVTSMPHAVRHSINDFVEAVAEAIGIVLLVSLHEPRLSHRYGRSNLDSTGTRGDRAVHVYVPYRPAQGFARHPDPRARPAGGRCHHFGRNDGGEARAGLRSHECRGVRLHQHRFSDALRHAGHGLGLSADRAGAVGDREYTRSIFEVSAIALLLSWLAAVIVIPLLGSRICRSIRPVVASARTRSRHLRALTTTSTIRCSTAACGAGSIWCIDRRRTVLDGGAGTVRRRPGGLRTRAAAVLPELRAAGAAGGSGCQKARRSQRRLREARSASRPSSRIGRRSIIS